MYVSINVTLLLWIINKESITILDKIVRPENLGLDNNYVNDNILY